METRRSVRRAWRAVAAVAMLAASLATGACGRPAGVIFDPAEGSRMWPPPPDQPRVRYVGQLISERDLKPARSFMQRLGTALMGEEPSRSMLSPMGVCTDGADRVFVADSNAQVLHVFDLATRRYQAWRPPEALARFSQPVATTFDAHAGRVLVADPVAGVVFAFNAEGEFLGTLGDGVLQRPCGLAVDAAGHLYVADTGAHQVVVLASDGEELGRLGGRGTAPGWFNFPTFVALDRDGRLYVSDSLNFRVQVFSRTLEPLVQFGSKGDMPGYFAQPKGLALDGDGHLYVVDANFEAVQVFTREGVLLMTFGHEGSGPGEFWLPAGIHIDSRDRIWIADSYNRRIQVFQYIREETRP